MVNEPKSEAVVTTMRQINRGWLNGCIEDLAPMVHPDVVMALPGFTGRIMGREVFLTGFRDFSRNATIHQFREQDQQVDIAGDTAVLNFGYEMGYERSGERYRATGRDL